MCGVERERASENEGVEFQTRERESESEVAGREGFDCAGCLIGVVVGDGLRRLAMLPC